jgi:hypothetical protein
MQQAIDAIKAKYNLSDEDAKKVLGVLVAAEHQRQTGASPAGMRGMKTADARGIDAGDLLGIAGSLLGGGQAGQQSGSPDLLGVIGDLIGGASNHPNQGGSGADLGGVLNGLLGGQSGQQSGSDTLGGLLGGLLGGGGQSHPAQSGSGTSDLLGLLGGLVGGAGGQQAAQGGDLSGLLGSLLGGGGAAPQQPTQGGGATFYSPQDVQHQPGQGSGAQLGQGTPGGKKDYGSIGDAIHKMSDAVRPKADKLGKMPKVKVQSGDKRSGKQKK